MNLILIEPGELHDDDTVLLSGPRAVHLQNVLKVRHGNEVRIGLIDGGTGRGTVVGLEDGTVRLHCALSGEPPPGQAVLLLALPRPKVLQRLWAQLAAIGVGRIILTNAARVERDYFDTHVLSPACYRPLLVEGLQQARDTRLPRVSIHRRFRVLVEDELDGLCPTELRVVAHPGMDRTPATVLRGDPGRRVLLAVGPEGGWNEFELGLLQTHRFQPVAMGERTLRSDTAVIAMLALVHDARRDAHPKASAQHDARLPRYDGR
jgi:RsmE family RNA methyltransferase